MVPVVRFIPSIQSCNTIGYLLGSTVSLFAIGKLQVRVYPINDVMLNAESTCASNPRHPCPCSIARTSICVTYSTLSVSITDVFHPQYAINNQF